MNSIKLFVKSQLSFGMCVCVEKRSFAQYELWVRFLTKFIRIIMCFVWSWALNADFLFLSLSLLLSPLKADYRIFHQNLHTTTIFAKIKANSSFRTFTTFVHISKHTQYENLLHSRNEKIDWLDKWQWTSVWILVPVWISNCICQLDD